MLFLLSALFLAPTKPIPWDAQLGKTWVLTEGWTGMAIELGTPEPDMPKDDWIGIIFQPDGKITWREVQPIDWSEGCSNAFGGFGGTWTKKGSQVQVHLIEYTRAMEEFPSTLAVERLEADTMVLQPVK